ncbi:MAG: type II secretion system protein [Gammaproteobacteria bacterium]|nr:type II secretion system protein [Gammaproteobacteria bacterium]
MNFAKGFTLIELAMVLFIVSLVFGGLLVPLATQLEGRQRNEARQQLERIEEALIGFAIINNRLPCPTTQADPTNANYGLEDATCPVAPTIDGILPWMTLGVRAVDPWGIPRTATTDPWTGYWRYRVHRDFSSATLFTLSKQTSASDQLSVQDSAGNLLTANTERPVLIVYSTGANLTADGQNATFEPTSGIYQGGTVSGNFDDITIWISRPYLFNYMVRAGKLP